MLTRRNALEGMGAGILATQIGGLRVALAGAATDRRLVVVILRGGLDGLAAVPAYADPDYRAQRGPLAVAEPGTGEGALDLDGRFGLHPALGPLHEMYRAGELVVFHAVATPYRERSHFDGQDLLENGTNAPRAARDGWLNRTLGLLGPSKRRLGLSVGQGVPLILRGDVPVGSWAPPLFPELDDDFLGRLARLYRRDPVLGPALMQGIEAQEIADEVLGSGGPMRRGRLRGAGALQAVARPVGKLLRDERGPRVAVLEAGGWDTHAGQGVLGGRLAARLRGLGQGLEALGQALGPAWRRTAIVVMTEFGRTVAVNGTGGTDHGTAGAAFLLGGAVEGGRVVTRWPGLATANLYEGRDLAPTLDLRSVLKGVLADHLSLPRDAIERVVFPESAAAPALDGLIRV